MPSALPYQSLLFNGAPHGGGAMNWVNRWQWMGVLGCLLLLSCLAPAEAQTMSRAPEVYNAQVYGRLRQAMSNRAAARTALPKKTQPGEAAGATDTRPLQPPKPLNSASPGR